MTRGDRRTRRGAETDSVGVTETQGLKGEATICGRDILIALTGQRVVAPDDGVGSPGSSG